MGLKGCTACLKWIVLVFNLIFWLAGMGILALSIYLWVDFIQYAQGNPHLAGYNTGVYILMGAGGIMSLVGFFGCCGAYRESPWMLGTFFTLLLLVFTAEVAAGVWAFVSKGTFDSVIDKGLQYPIENYDIDPVQTEVMDVIQREIRCCGIKGPRDWSSSKYGIGVTSSGSITPDIGVASSLGSYRVPKSCCSVPEDSILCHEAARSQRVLNTILNNIHTEGCRKALQRHLNDYMNIVAAVGIGIAVVEVLGMILTMVLCCAIRREDAYKH